MKIKYDRAVLFFLISALGMLIIERFNANLFHFFVVITGVFIGVLIFIVAINSKLYAERRLLLSVGVAYIYISVFDLLHLITYKGMALVEFDINTTTQFWLNARIIEAMSFIMIFNLARKAKKINYPATHTFLIMYTCLFTILTLSGILPSVYNEQGQTMLYYFIAGFIIVSLMASLVLANKLEMRKDLRYVFILSISLKIISEILLLITVKEHSTFVVYAHIFRYLSFGGIYIMFVKETILDPYSNVYKLFATKQEELTFKAERDSLTGIYDHSTTFIKVEELIEKIKDNQSLVVILLDIDDFKLVNDKYGHLKGDEVLRAFAQMLLTCDIKDKVIGRYGGDEFIISCSNVTKELIQLAFTSINQKMEELIEELGVAFTFSAGIAFYEKGDHTKDLIYKADIKMYEAKRLGKNQYLVW